MHVSATDRPLDQGSSVPREIIRVGELGPVIGSGRKARVHALDGERVVKLFIAPDEDEIAAEILAMSAAVEAGAPAPRIYGLADMEGRRGIVMERLRGESLLDLLEARPVARLRRTAEILADLAATIARCHAPGLPRAQERFADYCASSLVSDALGERTRALIGRLPAGERLIHGDLHPGNVMVTANGPVAIDWQWACRGPLGADAAFTRQNIASRVHPPDRRLAERGFRSALSTLYTHHYRRSSGTSRDEIAQWEPVAFIRRLGPLSRDGVRDLDTPLAALLARAGA